jgi:hypothetical protein
MFTEIIPGDPIGQPQPGCEFIVAHLKLSNVSTAPVDHIGLLELYVTGANGYNREPEIAECAQPSTYYAGNDVYADNYRDAGRLKPGVITERDLLVQAPIGDHTAELSWDPSSVWATQVTYGWNLGL